VYPYACVATYKTAKRISSTIASRTLQDVDRVWQIHAWFFVDNGFRSDRNGYATTWAGEFPKGGRCWRESPQKPIGMHNMGAKYQSHRGSPAGRGAQKYVVIDLNDRHCDRAPALGGLKKSRVSACRNATRVFIRLLSLDSRSTPDQGAAQRKKRPRQGNSPKRGIHRQGPVSAFPVGCSTESACSTRWY